MLNTNDPNEIEDNDFLSHLDDDRYHRFRRDNTDTNEPVNTNDECC